MPVKAGRRPITRPSIPKEDRKYSPNLGHELRRFREAFRMTQEEAAKKAGISQRVISRWENNQVNDLDGRILMRLGMLYGLSPNAVAQVAGWWEPTQPEQTANPKWDYVLRFLSRMDVSKEFKDRFIDLAYASCLAVQSLMETGGLERFSEQPAQARLAR